jgi:hypothetical protein
VTRLEREYSRHLFSQVKDAGNAINSVNELPHFTYGNYILVPVAKIRFGHGRFFDPPAVSHRKGINYPKNFKKIALLHESWIAYSAPRRPVASPISSTEPPTLYTDIEFQDP